MLKFPCPTEQELDKIRDKIWRQANRDPDQYFNLIKKKSNEFLQEHGYSVKPCSVNAGMIVKDKAKVKYKT